MEIISYQLEPFKEKGFVANYTVTLKPKSKKKLNFEEYFDSIRCFKVLVDEPTTTEGVKRLIMKDVSRRLNGKSPN